MSADRTGGKTTDRPARQGGARRGRPRRDQAGLSRELIVDTAARLISGAGVDKVTMRGISVELGVDPMSLYNYFGTKDDLLESVALRFLDTLPRPEPTGSLRADLRALAVAFRTAATAEPQVAVLLLTRPIRTMTGLTLIDDALGVLRTAGFGPGEAVFAFRSVFAFLVGTVLREASIGPTFADRNLGGIHERIDEIDAAGLHNVMESAEALSIVDHDQEFEFGLDVLVRGLERRLATGG